MTVTQLAFNALVLFKKPIPCWLVKMYLRSLSDDELKMFAENLNKAINEWVLEDG